MSLSEENYESTSPEANRDIEGAVEKTISRAQVAGEGVGEIVDAVAEAGRQELAAAGEDLAAAINEQGPSVLENISERARELLQKSEDYIRANPFQVVGIALGLGFVLGVKRRS